MRMIKPYGRTSVEPSNQSKRVLLRPESECIPCFAASHDELVLAQWISVIDKIATKPKIDKKPTKEQRELRTELGRAAWEEIKTHKLISEDHQDRWDAKLHPYLKGTDEPKDCYLSAKGPWFKRFCVKDTPINEADAAEVAQAIRKHLHEVELRKKPGGQKDPGGLIRTRAISIQENVLRLKDAPKEGYDHETTDDYKKRSDVARAIYEAIKTKYKGNDARRCSEIAGEALYKHWGNIFPNKGIKEAREADPALFALHMAVKDCYKRLLSAPHKKNAHARSGNATDPHPLLKTLPQDMDALAGLISNKHQNQGLAHLVRLGKVIHYTASNPDEQESRPDSPINAKRWNRIAQGDVIKNSSYWTTDGQTEIKRAEAFVRVWRRAIVFAARTLKDWADPENEIGGQINGDILLFKGWNKGLTFHSKHYEEKINILLGGREGFFEYKTEDEQKRHLFQAIEWTADVRHNIFHFNGLGGFVDSLSYLDPQKKIDDTIKEIESLQNELKQTKGSDNKNKIKSKIKNQESNQTRQEEKLNELKSILKDTKKLWQEDRKKRRERMRETMIGAHFDYFFNEEQNAKLLTAYLSPEAEQADMPLPRFSRMLKRAQNIKYGKYRLPEPAKRDKLEEDPALRCEYTAQKLLYELPFKAWLEKTNITRINLWIRQAIERTTQAAKNINQKKSEHEELIVARAAKIRLLTESERIHHFFFRLSEATASEMRVQNAYESNGENARKQAEYIEELKCDVIARAFVAYLETENFIFTKRRQEEKKPEKPICTINEENNTRNDESNPRNDESEPWQHILYFLLHLIPVEEVSALRHQLNKWEALAGKHNYNAGAHDRDKKASKQLLPVLRLYMDMHDAKFTGGAVQELHACQDLRNVFQSTEGFNRIFPKSQEAGAKADARIPIRGLREMMRFGHMKPLEHLFRAHKVRDDEVEAYQNKQKIISDAQTEREKLHKELTRNNGFTEEKCKKYVHFLAQVSEHRLLAARVTLTDHVRIHRLAMSVLARLVDYVGLWERDLYFVTLAAMWEDEKTFSFCDCANKELAKGRIIEALSLRFKNGPADDTSKLKLRNVNVEEKLKESIVRCFGHIWGERGKKTVVTNVKIRNDIAHLNMLKYGNGKPPLNLTDWVNHTRTLMAYDRKLKNAVTKSVKELLAREGLVLKWKMTDHTLGDAGLNARQARHLRKTKLPHKKLEPIVEDLHGDKFVKMAEALFDTDRVKRNLKNDIMALADKFSGGSHQRRHKAK